MISEDNFLNICKISKSVIQEFKHSVFINSIDELFVIRPHPNILARYKIIFQKFFIFRIIILFFYNICNSLRSILIESFKKKYQIKNTNLYDTIFVSHFFDKRMLNKSVQQDPYFSHFFHDSQNNTKNFIVYMNHSKKNYKHEESKIVLNKSLNFIMEIRLLLILFFNAFNLLKSYLSQTKKIEKRFILLIFVNLFSLSTLNNLRVFYQVKEIIKKTQIKKIIFTYEGHSFERIIIRAAYEVNQKILRYGFHHTLPFDNQFAFTIKMGNRYDPDYILSCGQKSFDFFNLIQFPEKNKVILVGSNRITNAKEIIKRKKSKVFCLVLPEGIPSEVDLLLSFCQDYILKYQNINFLIRFHPALKSIKKKYKKKFKKFDKQILFSDSLNYLDDFSDTDICLYRGTSLVYEAINYSIPSFYLNRPNEINFNPVFYKDKKDKKNFEIYSPEDLNRSLDIEITNSRIINPYSPVNLRNINKLLS